MRFKGSNRLADTVSSVAGMTIFMLFAAGCLVIIAVAASAYGRINTGYDDTFNYAASVRYITNRLRAGESAQIIDSSCILIGAEGCDTLIYQENGYIYERMLTGGQSLERQGGEELFRADSLCITESDGLLCITAEGDGNSFTAYCRCGGEAIEDFS